MTRIISKHEQRRGSGRVLEDGFDRMFIKQIANRPLTAREAWERSLANPFQLGVKKDQP